MEEKKDTRPFLERLQENLIPMLYEIFPLGRARAVPETPAFQPESVQVEPSAPMPVTPSRTETEIARTKENSSEYVRLMRTLVGDSWQDEPAPQQAPTLASTPDKAASLENIPQLPDGVAAADEGAQRFAPRAGGSRILE